MPAHAAKMAPRYDVAIVGAGIVGLAHALAAARLGLRVAVVDRDERANGASIRNFGFITVTGQSRGIVWERARRSRDVWSEVAESAGIPIVHRNECVVAHSAEAREVLEQFMATEMAAECELLDVHSLRQRLPMVRLENVSGALWSPHELRVEARTAIPALAAYLERRFDVTILRGLNVSGVAAPRLDTSAGPIEAERIIVAPGTDLTTLFPEIYARNGVRLCKLQMLRLAPQPQGWRLPASIMSDFGLIRYAGFRALPAAVPLRTLLTQRHPDVVGYGIHSIVVQSSDGSLVVGDSHDYAATPDPIYSSDVEAAILRLCHAVLDIPNSEVVERWIGVYPHSASREWLVEAPEAGARVVLVTSGNGISTSFAFAEEVIAEFCQTS
jgi:D-hydroxyproline dehydrogenase subunit beta